MMARYVWTLITLLFAAYAFWGDAGGMEHVFNPFGVLFLTLAVAIWFKWDSVREAFYAAQDDSEIPMLRMGYRALKGAGFNTPRDAVPLEPSSSDS